MTTYKKIRKMVSTECDACGRKDGDLSFICSFCEKAWCTDDCSTRAECMECKYVCCEDCIENGMVVECSVCLESICHDCSSLRDCIRCGDKVCHICTKSGSYDDHRSVHAICINCN